MSSGYRATQSEQQELGAVVSAKLTPVEKRLVQACAEVHGAVSLSQFVRSALLDCVRREFGDAVLPTSAVGADD